MSAELLVQSLTSIGHSRWVPMEDKLQSKSKEMNLVSRPLLRNANPFKEEIRVYRKRPRKK